MESASFLKLKQYLNPATDLSFNSVRMAGSSPVYAVPLGTQKTVGLSTSHRQQVMTPNRATRRCGKCTLCCKTVAVTPLKKPTGSWCRHACGDGCSIYPTRIAECRGFRCLWLDGCFDETDRPDHLEVVFFEESIADGQNIIVVSESYPGAAASPRVKELIGKLLESGIEVVVRNNQSVAKAYPDGRIVKFRVDQNDPLKVAVDPIPTFARKIPGKTDSKSDD